MNNDNSIGSVTHLLRQLRNGEATNAQQELWNRYFQRLAGFARTKLVSGVRRTADEEDVALSALNSFFRGSAKGRYPTLKDRTDLWPLLACIASRRALKQNRREFQKKRGSGAVRGDSALAHRASDEVGFDSLIGADPTPDSIVELQEVTDRYMRKLEHEGLREFARLNLSGYTNREIAEQQDVTERTVERKLMRIRHFWELMDEEL